jgi:hypothetical protein
MTTKVYLKATSEHGLTPNGAVSPENFLAWLNERIIECNLAIHSSAMNGGNGGDATGELRAYKRIKDQLFGEVYNT